MDLSHAAVDLGRKLFPLFALALDLPENYFNDKVLMGIAVCHQTLTAFIHPRHKTRLRSCVFCIIHLKRDQSTIV